MEDRCVHRAYPLSAGRLEGDRVVCGYHGFTYDPDGRCVEVPSQENVPRARACARSPSASRRRSSGSGWATRARPPCARRRGRRGSRTRDGRAPARRCTSRPTTCCCTSTTSTSPTSSSMHPEAVPPGIETLPPLDEVEVSEMSVSYSRVLPAARACRLGGGGDRAVARRRVRRREEGTFVSPALHVQRYAIDAEDGSAHEHCGSRDSRPRARRTSHVFLQIARNYATDRAVVADHLRAMFHEMGDARRGRAGDRPAPARR